MLLTAEHCGIAQSQGLQQPEQLRMRKRKYTIISEHKTKVLNIAKQLWLWLSSEHSNVHGKLLTPQTVGIWECGRWTVVLTGLLFLWRLAALWCWHVLCLWLCLWVNMWALSFGPGHQAEPCRWAGTGGLQDLTQSGTQFCFLFLL